MQITFIKAKSIYKNRIDIYSIYDLKNYIKSCRGNKLSYQNVIKNIVVYSYKVTHTEYKALKDLGLFESEKSFNEYFGFK